LGVRSCLNRRRFPHRLRRDFAKREKGKRHRLPKATIAYYERLGIKIERIMTDNGSCYRSKAFKKALKAFGLRQIFTRPYTPKTNGKAERFIQTSLREWAYAMACENSLQRQAQLAVWLHRYNWHRPHASLRAKPPVTRLGLSMDNLLRLHI
jgi:transposase InsO family protein